MIVICLLSSFSIEHMEAIYFSEIIEITLLVIQFFKISKNKERFKYNMLSLIIGIATLLIFFVKSNVYTLNGVYSYIMVFVLSIPNILAGGEKGEK